MNAQDHMARFLSALPIDILAVADVREKSRLPNVTWGNGKIAIYMHADGNLWIYAAGLPRTTHIDRLLNGQG